VPPRREIIDAPDAPAAVGPYSHAVRSGDLLFCSGQIPLDARTGEISGANAAEQVSVCLSNLQAVCRAAQTDLARAVRITVYLTDMADFASVNEAYGAYFPSDPPARVAIPMTRPLPAKGKPVTQDQRGKI